MACVLIDCGGVLCDYRMNFSSRVVVGDQSKGRRRGREGGGRYVKGEKGWSGGRVDQEGIQSAIVGRDDMECPMAGK